MNNHLVRRRSRCRRLVRKKREEILVENKKKQNVFTSLHWIRHRQGKEEEKKTNRIIDFVFDNRLCSWKSFIDESNLIFPMSIAFNR